MITFSGIKPLNPFFYGKILRRFTPFFMTYRTKHNELTYVSRSNTLSFVTTESRLSLRQYRTVIKTIIQIQIQTFLQGSRCQRSTREILYYGVIRQRRI